MLRFISDSADKKVFWLNKSSHAVLVVLAIFVCLPVLNERCSLTSKIISEKRVERRARFAGVNFDNLASAGSDHARCNAASL